MAVASVGPASGKKAEAFTTMEKVDTALANLEKNWLNKFGYIPLGVSAVSGKARITYAVAMFITAVAVAALQGTKGTVQGLGKDEMTGLGILKKYSFHALCNVGRGLVEIIVPTVSITGGVVLFIYDKCPTGIRVAKPEETPDITVPMPVFRTNWHLKAYLGYRVTYEKERYDGRSINATVGSRFRALVPQWASIKE